MERIRVESVSYSYQNKYQTVEAVKDVSCTFETGTLYAVTGESGSGKSTFLSLLAGLDCPNKGKIFVDGEDLSVIDRDAYRRNKVAVIYQAFHLFPLLTALENVRYPLEIQGMSRKEAGEQAKGYLSAVGISEEKFGKYPRMMSGGRTAEDSHCPGDGIRRKDRARRLSLRGIWIQRTRRMWWNFSGLLPMIGILQSFW